MEKQYVIFIANATWATPQHEDNTHIKVYFGHQNQLEHGFHDLLCLFAVGFGCLLFWIERAAPDGSYLDQVAVRPTKGITS